MADQLIYSDGKGRVILSKDSGAKYVRVRYSGLLTKKQAEVVDSVNLRISDVNIAWNAIKYHFKDFNEVFQ